MACCILMFQYGQDILTWHIFLALSGSYGSSIIKSCHAWPHITDVTVRWYRTWANWLKMNWQSGPQGPLTWPHWISFNGVTRRLECTKWWHQIFFGGGGHHESKIFFEKANFGHFFWLRSGGKWGGEAKPLTRMSPSPLLTATECT